jgi:hypothetical protein
VARALHSLGFPHPAQNASFSFPSLVLFYISFFEEIFSTDIEIWKKREIMEKKN